MQQHLSEKVQQQITVLTARMENVSAIRRRTLDLAMQDLYLQVSRVIDDLAAEVFRLSKENAELKQKLKA
jgi:hypothetical protein